MVYREAKEAISVNMPEKNLADLFTKGLTTTRREFLLERFTY